MRLSIYWNFYSNRNLGTTQKKIVLAILKKLEDYTTPDDVLLDKRIKGMKEQVVVKKEKTLEMGRVIDLNSMILRGM